MPVSPDTQSDSPSMPASTRLSRRALLTRALVVGAAVPAVGSLLAACTPSAPASQPATSAAASTPAAAAKAATSAPAAAATTAPATAANKPASLNMLYATVEADVDAVKLVIPDFKSQFGIDINLDSMPYDAVQQKTFAEFASSSTYYDINIVDTPWTPSITGKLEPLSAYLTNTSLNDTAKVDLQDFIPKVFYDTAVYNAGKPNLQFPSQDKIDLSGITAQGFDVYGLPLQANALTLAYRKDLFDSADEKAKFQQQTGKPLAVPETWDDFQSVAQFFSRPDQRLYGTTLMAGNGDWATDDFKTLLACWGGDGHLISDKFELAFNSQQGIDALTFYADLINKHKVTPPGATSFSWDEAATTFDSGLTAMSMNYHQEELKPEVKGEVAYALVPKKVNYGPHFGTWMISINKFSKNKEWAYRAIAWMTSADVQTKMLQTQLHPTRMSVYAKAGADAALKQKFGNFYEVLGKSLAVGVGRPRLTNYGAVDKEIWVAVNQAATGAKAPKDALSEAATRVTAVLKEAGYSVGG